MGALREWVYVCARTRSNITMSISEILDDIEVRAEPFALCELHGRCRLDVAWESFTALHHVLAGQGQIVLPGRPPLQLERGMLALIPALTPHTIHSGGERAELPSCRPAAVNLAHLVLHSDGDEEQGGLIAICSRVTLSLRRMQNLFDIVREPMLELAPPETAVGAPFGRLLQELGAPGGGSEAMVRALLQQSLLELMRQRLSDNNDNLNWMAALRDPTLWPVLREMLDAPGADHSAESLAATATMSRSVFADRFTKAYGSGPMELLRELRMRLAASLLADTSTPVKRVAALAGFLSRSAFTRAFTERTGEPPADFRQKRKAGPDEG